MSIKRAKKSQELMELVKTLEDPQMELILLRSCIGVAKLYFALRTCPLEEFLDAEEIVDAALRSSFEEIVTGGRGGFGELQVRIATLPIKFGGLGVITVGDSKNYAFLASFLQTEELQNTMIRGKVLARGSRFQSALVNYQSEVPVSEALTLALENDYVPKTKLMKTLADDYFKGMVTVLETEYSLSDRQSAVWKSLQVPHSQDFLYTLPIEGLGQTMSATEYRAVLSYRLMVPMFNDDMDCFGCNKVPMDSFGDHAIHCKFDPGIKFRHDIVKDGLVDIMKRVGITVRKEAPISLHKEGVNSVLRHADVLIYNWVQGKHTCVDLSGCSPLVGYDKWRFDQFKALKNMVKKKYEKHDEACHEAGLEFIPFGFTSFGGLCDEAAELFRRVEKITSQHFTCIRDSRFVFHRLGFFIQKGIAAQLVSRLPINFVSD